MAVIPSPIAVLSGGVKGPTALLIAGTHGDEYEGQILLQELHRGIDPAEVSGRLIVLPALNIAAVKGRTPRCQCGRSEPQQGPFRATPPGVRRSR